MDLFVGKHCGYARLGVGVQRTIRLDKTEQALEIADVVSGSGSHEVAIPFHLAPGVAVEHEGNSIILSSSGRRFKVTVKGDGWATAVDECLISPSYGCAISSRRFVCTRTGPLPADLTTLIRPLSTIS
jgi:hypothetical protein